MSACPTVEPEEYDAPPVRFRRPTEPPPWLVIAAFAAVYVIWGSTYVGIRLAIDSMPPLLMAGARALLAGALLYPILRATGAPRPGAVHWKSATIVGGLLLFAGNGGVSWAEKTVPSNITALMVAAVPLWMNLLEWLRPAGVRPHGAAFAGLAVGFAGVALIVLSKDQHGQSVVPLAGACVLLVAPFCWALGSIWARHATQTSSALLNIAMQMICGGAIMLLGGAAMGEIRQLHFDQITAQSAWAFVYLTFIGSLVGFTAYVWLLKVSTPARVSTYAYVNPLIAAILGRAFLGEALPQGVILAGALIIAAVILLTRAKPARRKLERASA
jgi:drug/metabolite transporter (DMT)-like permease